MMVSKSTNCPKNDKPPCVHMQQQQKMEDQIHDGFKTTSEAAGFSSNTVKRRYTLADDAFGSLSYSPVPLRQQRKKEYQSR